MPHTAPARATGGVTPRGRNVLAVIRLLGSGVTVAQIAAYHPLGMDAQGVRNNIAALTASGHVQPVPGTRPRQFGLTAAGAALAG
jgi:hypothetical protein